MAEFTAGIIGCGGRGRSHARGYQASQEVEILACADPVEESRQGFAAEFEVPNVYENYEEMLEKENLDFVSVCTWTGMHRDMVVDAACSGIRAVHSEKPMAPTWGEAKELYQACVDNEVVVTFCHQRRFAPSFRKVKALLDEGAIGELIRLEGACPNLFDWGTHWFDMFFFYNNDEPAQWVIGQIDVAEDSQVFGVALETSGLSWIRWKNGVEGLLATGGVELQHASNRLIGTEGMIEVGGKDKPPVRLLKGGKWEAPDVTRSEANATTDSVLDLIACVKSGEEPELSGRKALQATELIFATYESSRKRGRVDLPLETTDSALLSMLDEGVIGPGRE